MGTTFWEPRGAVLGCRIPWWPGHRSHRRMGPASNLPMPGIWPWWRRWSWAARLGTSGWLWCHWSWSPRHGGLYAFYLITMITSYDHSGHKIKLSIFWGYLMCELWSVLQMFTSAGCEDGFLPAAAHVNQLGSLGSSAALTSNRLAGTMTIQSQCLRV